MFRNWGFAIRAYIGERRQVMIDKKPLKTLFLFSCSLLLLVFGINSAFAATAAEIDKKAKQALEDLYRVSPEAKKLAKDAKGILVFPKIYKAGFLAGAQYGEGALIANGKTMGYYKSIAGSFGLQAGVQTFGYALFFMTDKALSYLASSKGWEIGVGPSIVVVNKGVARSLTTTTGKADIYAFFFNQKGLMAGMGLQGTKITPFTPEQKEKK